MKGDKVYLLYNKADDTIQLQGGPKKGLQWEYLDKDEFTIVYRPQSASAGIRQGEGSVEGILFRRSSSLSTIEDLFLARRCPLIRPLLSETEIARIQKAQDQCRREHIELSGRKLLSDEVKTEDVQQLELLATPDFRPDDGRGEHPGLGESPREKLKTTSPFTDSKDKRKLSGTAATLTKDKKEKKDDREKDTTIKRKPVGKTKLIDKERNEVKKPKTAEKSVKSEVKPKAKSTEKEILVRDKVDVRETKSKKKGKESDSDVLKEGKKGHKKNADESDSELRKRKITKGKKDLDSDEVKLDKKKKKSLDKKIDINKSLKSKQKHSTIELKTDTDGKDNLSKKRIKSEPGKGEDVDKKQKHPREASSSRTEKSDKPASSKQSDKKGKGHKLEEATSELGDETYKSRKPSVDKKKKQVGEDSDHQDVAPVDKSTKGMGEKGKGSVPEKKEGKTKSPLSKMSLGSPTSKDRKQPSIFEHKRERQSLADRRSKRLSSIENIIYYVLSNPIFVKMGWTLTPKDRTVSRVVTFRTNPVNPQTYCFRHREEDETKFYPSGNLAVRMEIDGTGGIFYSNGSPAMLIRNTDTGMRLTMYSNPKKDPLIKDSFAAKVIGIFDSFGNGVINDLEGNKILNFNQFEGVFNNQLKSVTHRWRWSDYDILQKYREKELLNFMARKSQAEPEVVKGKKGAISAGADKKAKSLEKNPELGSFYKRILAELPFPQPQKTKVLNEHSNMGFKSIILKINKEMALRINGQDSVFVNFFSDKIFYRIDLGIRVDPEIVERIEDLAPDRMSGIPCVFDSLFHLSASLQEINNLHMDQAKNNTLGKYLPLKIN